MKDNTKINLLGIYLLSFLLVLIILTIIVYFSNFESSLIKSLIYIGSSGGIGGTIYTIRGFYQHLGENDFKFSWVWWYIFRPIISVVVGVFLYFLILGGLMSFRSVSEINYSRNILFFCAIAFLAGFSFTQFANKLEGISSTLFSKKKEDNKWL